MRTPLIPVKVTVGVTILFEYPTRVFPLEITNSVNPLPNNVIWFESTTLPIPWVVQIPMVL